MFPFKSKRRKNVRGGHASVLLIADRPNWAYDAIARALVKFNQDPDLQLDIEYVKNGNRRIRDIQNSYDLLFFLGWQTLSIDGRFKIADRVLDRKRIITGVHSHHAWDQRQTTPDHSIGPPNELIEFLNQFAGVNTVSHRLYELFLASGVSNLVLTQNGVDTSLFVVDRKQQTPGTLRVGFSGNNRHDWRKGISEYIEPATSLEGVSLHLAMPSSDCHLEQSEMPRFYNGIDVYVCASSSEGFSLSVLEAASSGCPVISTRVGGCEDLIIDGLNGFLVDRTVDGIREKIKVLRDNPELVTEMGSLNRRVVMQLWSWEIRCREWLAFIKSRL